MKFRFKLARVLHHRRRRLESEARKLHAIESAAHALKRDSASREARCRELALAGSPLVTDADLEHRRRVTAHAQGQERLIRRNAEKIHAIRRRADAQRRILLAAQRDTRVLELLRDRQREAWVLRQRQLEQKLTDEIASRRSGR